MDVPATSGNVGPGFDVAGLALTLFNGMQVELDESGLTIEVRGEGADTLPRDESNIIVQAMQRVFAEAGRAMPCVRLLLTNRIPLARGLGSSAAARVAGVVAANELLSKSKRLSSDRLLAVATALEGHPDNVAPALFGGVVLSVVECDGAVAFARIFPHRPPSLVALIPSAELATSKARAVLPKQVPLQDAVFNVGRTALFVAGMKTGRADLLRAALRDRLHQPYRAQLMPWLPQCIQAAIDAGALGAVLSGAGTTILAMTRRNSKQVGNAMLQALRRHGIDGRIEMLSISSRGALLNGTPLPQPHNH